MCPSEYSYHEDSVYRTERTSANCRNYLQTELPTEPGVHPENNIHCDGTQLRLTDSDIGAEQYTPSDYYVWLGDETRSSQLLFIFPTRVHLTTITLHYFSTSGRGLPRLRFWAVPDNFDIWDAPTSSYSYVEVAAVPPSEWSAGRKNVSVSFNVTTTKILMVKFSSSFSFAVSEVKFFNYNCKQTRSTSS